MHHGNMATLQAPSSCKRTTVRQTVDKVLVVDVQFMFAVLEYLIDLLNHSLSLSLTHSLSHSLTRTFGLVESKTNQAESQPQLDTLARALHSHSH